VGGSRDRGSGAIGSAVCRHFAEAGATCIVTYNHGKKAAKDLLLPSRAGALVRQRAGRRQQRAEHACGRTSRRSTAGSTCWSIARASPVMAA